MDNREKDIKEWLVGSIKIHNFNQGRWNTTCLHGKRLLDNSWQYAIIQWSWGSPKLICHFHKGKRFI